MVAWAPSRPARVLAAVLTLAVLGGGLALWRLSPSASTSTLVGSGSKAGRATAVVHSRFGDDAVYVLVRGDLARLVLTSDLNRLLGLEGCLAGNVPAGADVPGGSAWAVRRAGAGEAGAGGLRARHVHQLLRRGDHQAAAGADARAGGAGRARERGGAQARAGRRALEGRGAAVGQAGRAARLRAVRAGAAGPERQVRAEPDGRAEGQRPGLRLLARLRCRARRAAAEGAVRVPVPVGGLGADLGAPEGGAQRRGARPGGVAGPRGGGDARLAARRRRPLCRDRRAGARRRPDGRAGVLDAAAAAGRGGGDGAGARRAVPGAVAAAAAGAGAVRGGDRLRRAGAAWACR